MAGNGQPQVVVYSRQGCHLCEVLIEQLLPLLRGRAGVAVVDVDTRAELRSQYGLRVPVVEFDGRLLCEFQLDPAAVEKALAAHGREQQ